MARHQTGNASKDEVISAVPCPLCLAGEGEKCLHMIEGTPMATIHRERREVMVGYVPGPRKSTKERKIKAPLTGQERERWQRWSRAKTEERRVRQQVTEDTTKFDAWLRDC